MREAGEDTKPKVLAPTQRKGLGVDVYIARSHAFRLDNSRSWSC